METSNKQKPKSSTGAGPGWLYWIGRWMAWPKTKARPNLAPWLRIIWNVIWGVPAMVALFIYCALIAVMYLSIQQGVNTWRMAS